jgi:hypothetical protein
MGRWAWPSNSRKAHYFDDDGRSLCGNWAFFGTQNMSQRMGEKPGREDCISCWRKAKSLAASAPEKKEEPK